MTSKSGKFFIPSLDGIRAVAVLIVFLSHAGVKYVPGGFGVTVFFFLSGYLITTLLRREHDRSSRIDLKKFYMRRVLRILPPFYLVLLLAIGASWLIGVYSEFSSLQLEALVSQFFHYSNYHNVVYGNQYMSLGTEVYWSLAVEEHFYLLFPLGYILLRRFKFEASRQALIFLGVCALVLLWRCLLVFFMGADYDRIFFATDTRIDSILFGCAMAVAYNPAMEQDRQISDRNLKWVFLPLGFALLLVTLVVRADYFRDTLRYSVQGVALFPIFMAAIRFPDWFLFKPLNWNWVRFVGVLSYSLYLVHFVVIKVLVTTMPELGMLATGLISLVISFVISYGIYRFAEVPAAKLKRKYASH